MSLFLSSVVCDELELVQIGRKSFCLKNPSLAGRQGGDERMGCLVAKISIRILDCVVEFRVVLLHG